jgi:hypothetical protein
MYLFFNVHPCSLLFNAYRGPFPQRSRGRNVKLAPPPDGKVKDDWNCDSIPPDAFMEWTETIYLYLT